VCSVYGHPRLSRDAGHVNFLGCAVAGRAGYIVSVGTDLRPPSAVQGIPIFSAPDFWGTLERVDR